MEERLNKFISNCGVCSRRTADQYIMEGRVCVNGKTITELGYKVKDSDIVVVDGKELKKEAEKIYIALNKPVGYVSTAKEQLNRPCVTDLVKLNERLYPVGRLDMFSEGLLILTNDGELVNRVIHPAKHVGKTYEVTLTSKIQDIHILELQNGVDIGGYVTKKANVEKTSDTTFNIVIFEGKNRQIRKMCEALGYKVKKLKRTKIGELELGDLKVGKYIKLTKEQINKIFERR